MHLLANLLLFLPFFLVTSALEVAPDSTCAPLCMNTPGQDVSLPETSQTFTSELTCKDSDYGTTAVGNKYQNCINCLLKSKAVDAKSGESDLYWALYNIKKTFTYCVFGSFNNSDFQTSPCTPSCAPLQNALQYGTPTDNASIPIYDYCHGPNGGLPDNIADRCTDCLRRTDNEKYMSNFLASVRAACGQRPPSGSLLQIQGSLFSTTPITFINSTAGAPGTNTASGLSAGAKAGIAIGALAGAAILVSIFYIARRRRIARNTRYTSPTLDSRFGNPSITAPVAGGWSSSPGYQDSHFPPAVPDTPHYNHPSPHHYSSPTTPYSAQSSDSKTPWLPHSTPPPRYPTSPSTPRTKRRGWWESNSPIDKKSKSGLGLQEFVHDPVPPPAAYVDPAVLNRAVSYSPHREYQPANYFFDNEPVGSMGTPPPVPQPTGGLRVDTGAGGDSKRSSREVEGGEDEIARMYPPPPPVKDGKE
ncbi:MAG: hypothetical protein M1814_003861 [Vezdaea aestivalis]|nr:MAG: hypothetical protein M1814_003861 [Vezdaea aestivalis]